MSVRKLMPWLAIALVATLALAVTAVGSAKPAAATKIAAPTAVAATTPLKVALVTDIGGLDDRSFTVVSGKFGLGFEPNFLSNQPS